MDRVLTRRPVVCLLGSVWLPTRAGQRGPSLTAWLIGDWLSDRERTMENFYFQGRSLNEVQRERIATLFGRLRYHITSRSFEVVQGENKLRAEYKLAAESDSTITLRFQRAKGMPDLTLYCEDYDALFIKLGYILEYFRRTAV